MKRGGGLTEAMVRGAGHLVPMDKGPETLDMINRFIYDRSFPAYHFSGNPDFVPEIRYYYENLKRIDFGSDPVERSSSGFKTAMILSLVFNVLLACGGIAGIWYYKIRMRRYVNYMYATQDDSSLSLEV